MPSSGLASRPPAPVFKSIDESTEVETSEMLTDGNTSPMKRDLFGDLNLAESLDEHPVLLEGSESERGQCHLCNELLLFA